MRRRGWGFHRYVTRSRAGLPGQTPPAAPAPRPSWARRRGRALAQPQRTGTSWVATVMAQGVPVVVAALIAAFIAVFTNVQAQRATNTQLRIAEQGQITNRYNAAVTNLGSRSIDVRLGGVYALQRLMKDSPPDQPTVIAVLCAFVRDRATGSAGPSNFRQPTDIQAALTVVGTRNTAKEGRTTVVDFDHAQLATAQLPGLHLSRANFSDADLRGADLSGADLRGADLNGAGLRGADLAGAHLCGANLRSARTSATRAFAARTSAARTSAARTSVARTSAARTSTARTSAARTSPTRTSATRASSSRTSVARTSATRTCVARISAARASVRGLSAAGPPWRYLRRRGPPWRGSQRRGPQRGKMA